MGGSVLDQGNRIQVFNLTGNLPVQGYSSVTYICRYTKERDYRWRHVSKACNQRSRHVRVLDVCVQNKGQPRKKPLTLA